MNYSNTAKSALSPVILSSYPKSGRTWLRFILANYITQTYNLNLDVDFWCLFTLVPNGGKDPKKGLPAYQLGDRPDIPLILATHGFWHQKFIERKVIWLIRSPADVLVSHYCHLSYSMGIYNNSISNFLRSPEQGLNRLIVYLNQWSQHLDENKTRILSYEQMQSQPHGTLKALIEFIGMPWDKPALEYAIEAASFGIMRAIETKKGAPWVRGNQENSAALRTRRGEVGSYHKHLSEEDIIYIQQQCEAKLIPAAKQLLTEAGCQIITQTASTV